MGEKQALCANCSAQNQNTSGGGASIGAIRPNLKIVRLKPGESPPPGYVHPGSVSASAQIPPVVETPPIVESQAAPIPTYAPPPVSQEPKKHSSDTWRVFLGTTLILVAAWGTVILFKNGFLRSGSSPEPSRPEVNPDSDFSHIVIHQKREVIVDGKTIVGRFEIEDEPLALTSVQASWSKGKKLLQLDYYGAIPKELGSRFPGARPTEPLVRVQMQFASSVSALDREKLQSYLIEFFGAEKPARFVKTYSPQLAAFGEVSPLAGTLKPGEIVRGALRDTRVSERDGKTEKVSWELGFQVPLGAIP